MKKLSLFFVSLLFLVSCAGPGTYLRESDVSLTETRKAIVKLYGEPRNLSQNGREMWTQYMDKKGRVLESMKKAKERRYAHIKILGERRPYDILVHVVVQEQDLDGSYDDEDTDDELEELIIKEIKMELLKSLENRNIIDDFNAF